MSSMNRRQFVTLAAGVMACACGLEALADEAPPATGPVDIGTLADYPTDGAFGQFARSHKVLVVRNAGRLYACTANCTHKRKTLTVRDGEIRCPAHSSVFGLDGTPTAGPAKEPLVRFAITRRDDGHLLVDPAKTFGPGEWNTPAAFITIPA